MLSGQRAFHGDSAAETMSAILREEPPDLSVTNQNVSPGLERIVRHCIEKNPEQRFHSAHDLAFDLEALSGTSVTGAIATSTLRRRPRLVPTALAVALLALPLIGYLLGKRAVRATSAASPSYRQLTFHHGAITGARFAPDGQTIVFSAALEGGPLQLFSTRLEFPESRPLGFGSAALLSVSLQGELAIIVGGETQPHLMVRGTLSQAALAGGAPREILEDVLFADWAPDGKSLAVVHRVGGRERLEFPIGKVLYETSGWISHPRVAPGGDRIAFFDHPAWPDDRGSVAAVDLLGKKRTLSTGWESEEGLAWSADGNEVWFTVTPAGLARDLLAVDLAGRQRMIARVPGGTLLQDVFRDGRALLTRDTERLSILSLAPGETKERDLAWLEWSLPTDLSADGKTLLFCEQGQGGGPNYTACLRKTDGSPVVRLGEGYPTEISSDGKWVLSVLTTSPEQLRLMPTGPGEPKRLEAGSIENYLGASFFPDGKRILLCGKEPGGSAGLYVQELSGGKPRRIGEGVTPLGSHPISPDGKTIVALDAGQKIVFVPRREDRRGRSQERRGRIGLCAGPTTARSSSPAGGCP
jgi:Tol biopolymer transport system component